MPRGCLPPGIEVPVQTKYVRKPSKLSEQNTYILVLVRSRNVVAFLQQGISLGLRLCGSSQLLLIIHLPHLFRLWAKAQQLDVKLERSIRRNLWRTSTGTVGVPIGKGSAQ